MYPLVVAEGFGVAVCGMGDVWSPGGIVDGIVLLVGEFIDFHVCGPLWFGLVGFL